MVLALFCNALSALLIPLQSGIWFTVKLRIRQRMRRFRLVPLQVQMAGECVDKTLH